MSTLLEIANEILMDSGREPLMALVDQLRLREDLKFDSLELAVLTVKIEAQFGIDVFADGIVSTIGDIEEKIRRYQKGN